MRVPREPSTAAGRLTKGAQTTISTSDTPLINGSQSAKNREVSPAVLYIFQFPARTGVRISFQNSVVSGKTAPCVYGALQIKFAASSVLPVPLYLATCGYGHSGRVRSIFPPVECDARISAGALPCSTH